MPAADRPIGDERRTTGKRRYYLCRAWRKRHYFQKGAVEDRNAGHQWMSWVMNIGREFASASVCRVVKRIVVPGSPSASDGAGGAGAVKAIGGLDYHPTAIHTRGQIFDKS